VNAGLNLWSLFGLNPGPRDFYATSLTDPITGQPRGAGGAFDIGANEFA